MTTVAEHYENHLAPVYLWMAGGFDTAISRGEREINAICLNPSNGLSAVDLGAGFGMHSIPLARRGYSVVAIDSSPKLLDALREHVGTLPIQTVEDDLLAFPKHLNMKAHLILCMGDRLTHLPDPKSVDQLFSLVAELLHPGGSFTTITVTLCLTSRFNSVKYATAVLESSQTTTAMGSGFRVATGRVNLLRFCIICIP